MRSPGERRLRVLFVDPGPRARGGISAVIENYRRSRFWARNECVEYGTTRDGSPAVRMGHDLLRCMGFPAALARTRPDLVSIHVSSGTSFLRKLPYASIAKAMGRRVVVHVHPAHFVDYVRRSGPATRRAISSMLRGADGVVVLSEEIASALSEAVPGIRPVVLPNPVDAALYSPGQGPPAERHTVLFLGAMFRQKGAFDLVDAVPALRESVPTARVVLAGSHDQPLREYVESEGLTERVEVLGWAGPAEKLRLLREARVLVLPSYSEGLPNVLLEAMAAGVPVVTTPVGGVPSLVKHESNGLLVAPGRPDEIASAVARLFTDHALWSALSARGRSAIDQRYDVNAVCGSLENLYRQLVE